MFRVNEMMGNFSKEVAMFGAEDEAINYVSMRRDDYINSEFTDGLSDDDYYTENETFLSNFNIEDDGRQSIDDGQLTEMYDDMLDECYPEMFGMSASIILYRADNIAYNCGLNDFYDSISDSYYCEEME